MRIEQTCLCTLILTMTLLTCGCDSPSSVEATPRNSQKTPLFASDATTADGDSTQTVDSVRDVAQLAQTNHNVCVVLKLPELIKNPDLADVDWAGLNQALETYVGAANANVDSIAAAAILAELQGAKLLAMANGADSFPGVLAIEFKKPIDVSALPAELEAKKRRFSREIVARVIEERFVLLGRPRDIDSIEFRSSRMASQVRALNPADQPCAFCGIVSFGSMQEQLDGIFKMMSNVPGLDLGRLAMFPQFADRLEFSGSLNDEQVLELNIFTEDAELNAAIAARIGSAFSDASDGSGMSGAFSGMEMMAASAAAPIGQRVAAEIADENLLRVSSDSDRVAITLSKPTELSQLIQALVADNVQQSKLAERVERLRSIADALESWSDKNADLQELFQPPKSGSPFNWRVALLPAMGQQELYDKFNFEEAWDSDSNLAIAMESNPFGDEAGQTSLHLATGKRAADLAQKDAKQDAEDAKSKENSAWLLMEYGPSKQTMWTAPTSAKTSDADPAGALQTLGLPDENGILIINADFEVQAISKENPDEAVICPGIKQEMPSVNFGSGFGF